MNNSLIQGRYQKLEKIYEYTTYLIILVGLLVIQLPLPFEVDKLSVYLVALVVSLFTVIWHRLIPKKYYGVAKNFIESVVGLLGIFIIVNATGGFRSYFSFFYFLPVLSSAVYMPARLSVGIAFFTSLLMISPLFSYFETTEFSAFISFTGLQVWAVWLIYAYGRFLAKEITIAKRGEEEVKLEEIKEVEKLKNEFIFMVSHELRSPITAIRGYLEFLTTDQSGGLNNKISRILRKAFITSNKLANLVTLLLEAARLETGKIHFYIQGVPIHESFSRVKFNLKNEIIEKNIDLVEGIPKNLKVDVDAERLDEMLNIILNNAIVYTPEFGKVEVLAKEKGKQVEIKIIDTGVGMSKEKQDRLFEKFYTEKTALGEATIRGINIGMYVVKQLLLKMRGDIDVESKVGVGTTFTLKLPSSKSTVIKALMFDAGGVLFNSSVALFDEPINYISEVTGKDRQIVEKVYRELITEYESKPVIKEDLWKSLAEKLGTDVPFSGPDPISVGFKKFKGDKEVLDLIGQLKSRYRLAVVSNANSIESQTPQAKKVYKYFNEVILSYRVGVRKPNPNIYQIAFDQLEVKPEETVFIDNSPENVKEANELGMTGVLFKNARQLKEDLKKVGVEISF